MAERLEIEGEDGAPSLIFRCGADRYDRMNQPVERVAECWTEEEVRAFKLRRDSTYIVYVKRQPIPLHVLL